MTKTHWAVLGLVLVIVAMVVVVAVHHRQAPAPSTKGAYLGFDRNDYPGDDRLPTLKKTFSFAGYWLNVPPGDPNGNLWQGKREVLQKAGFGFALLYNGRTYRQLRASGSAADIGKQDGTAAVEAARREGFPSNAIIFLDVEEGGRLLAEQRDYLFSWIDTVAGSGFRAGVYCAGIRVPAEAGKIISTADDIREHANNRLIAYWVSNDMCAPSPGCTFPADAPPPSTSGIDFADVWQYVQSPRRKQYTAKCAQTYGGDGRCFPPGLAEVDIDVDVSSASSADPSGGRKR